MFCTNCGSKVNDGARFCDCCGSLLYYNNEAGSDSYEKNKCSFLREIRKTIAQMNHVEIDFPECTHTGACRGTCDACDHEIMTLESELKEKVLRGEKVFLPDVTVDHQAIIPSHLRGVSVAINGGNYVSGSAEREMNHIPLAGVPAPEYHEKVTDRKKESRFPWRR